MQVCKHCGKEFNLVGRVFSNHVRWCEKNPNRNNLDNLTKAVQEHFDTIKGKITKFSVKCYKCGKDFFVMERSKNFPTKERYYCSRQCANSHERTAESIQKTVNSINKYLDNHPERRRWVNVYTCPRCNQRITLKYRITPEKAKTKHCNKCSREIKLEIMSSENNISSYRRMCTFKFGLSTYPDEFDFALIEEYGWYSPSNKKNNLKGVSRDHIISVRYGFDNKIDPAIISHPANCQLLIHNKNISKFSKCGMTLKDLLRKIKKWDKKYGKYIPRKT